jgi:pyruvate ferredoxin oxidoreductase gamma subunit
MFRIRFHGRGGQGIKTAGRILGSAFFAEGFEVQDAPLYGAERRGAPIHSTVRAARTPIFERGPVRRPDLVVVADETLLAVAAAGVLAGVSQRGVLLLCSRESEETWRARLPLPGSLFVLPPASEDARLLGAVCAGAAARLVGVVARASLEHALGQELSGLPEADRRESREQALAAFERMAPHAGVVREGEEPDAAALPAPAWIELADELGPASEPAILAPGSSVQVRTGLWRTTRPVLDAERCHRCSWICTTFCPDGAIHAEPGEPPVIDYDHCKGCLVCVAVCPPHAIRAVPEREAQAAEARGAAAAPPGAAR